MSKLQYTFKTDTLFKVLFVKHQDLLQKLVAALLGIKNGTTSILPEWSSASSGAGYRQIALACPTHMRKGPDITSGPSSDLPLVF